MSYGSIVQTSDLAKPGTPEARVHDPVGEHPEGLLYDPGKAQHDGVKNTSHVYDDGNHHLNSNEVETEKSLGSGHGANDTGEKSRYQTMTRDKRFIVITFILVNFGLGMFYSLLGPFFPNEAAKKGVSSTIIGLIFGVFELMLVIMSPVFGNLLTHIGSKFMFCTGVMVCGSSAILFGFLDMSPDGGVYITMCFSVRIIEGLGAAGFATASFAIMAHTFPKNVATMFGTLELFTGLGLMCGPPIGGALYQLGGFRLPFVLSGSLMLLIGIFSVFLLPSVEDLVPSRGNFVFGLLRIPLVCFMGAFLMIGSGIIGFLDVGLSPYLAEVYNLKPVIVGLVFMVAPGIYTLSAPLWGIIADKKPGSSHWWIILGYIISGAALFFVAPAPFLPIPNNLLWLLLVSQGFGGFGIGTLVITFQIITDATSEYGYPDTLETYGLISGIFNSFFSLGAFAGPLLGGYLIDTLEFPMATVVMGSGSIGVSVIFLLYLICTTIWGKKKMSGNESDDENETTPVMKQAH